MYTYIHEYIHTYMHACIHTGIVNYAQRAAAEGVESEVKGVNHVFDQRLGPRVGTEVVAQ